MRCIGEVRERRGEDRKRRSGTTDNNGGEKVEVEACLISQ